MNSQLRVSLSKKKFVFTAETSPPDSGNAQTVSNQVSCLKDVADALNVTDGAGAKAHMSALATSAIIAQNILSQFFNSLLEIEIELQYRVIY